MLSLLPHQVLIMQRFNQLSLLKVVYMKLQFLIIVFLLSFSGEAQELFSVTEPASNMAARSIGFRLDNSLMDEVNSSKINYHLIPEIRVGVSKKLMIEGGVFFSNRNDRFRLEGGSV